MADYALSMVGGALMIWALLVAVVSYLIGSIPFAVIVSRLVKGIDLRQHGSGNMGATNAARVLGKRWFPLVFGLDFAKGLLCAYGAGHLLAASAGLDPVLGAAIGGLAAVVGHCFPVYVGFQGGVGLAASAGALVVLSPWLLVPLAVTLLAGWLILRNMYMGTICAALLLPLYGWFLLRTAPVVWTLVLWGLLIAWLHRKDAAAWWAGRR